METRKCIKCGDVKPLTGDYFSVNKKSLSAKCILCYRNSIKKWNVDNKERVQKKCKEWQEENWQQRLLYGSHHNRKIRERKGRVCEVSITIEDINKLWESQSGRCYFTNVPMTTKMYSLDTVSLDRLDNSLGYTPDNVVLSAKAINLARGIHSVDEFFEFIKKVKSNV